MFIDICFLICFWVIELLLFCLDFGNAAHPNAPLIRRSLKILGKVVSVQLKVWLLMMRNQIRMRFLPKLL
ncbi:hypothetical protein Hanom_Chr11g01002791 [Helianthus anomalus]